MFGHRRTRLDGIHVDANHPYSGFGKFFPGRATPGGVSDVSGRITWSRVAVGGCVMYVRLVYQV